VITHLEFADALVISRCIVALGTLIWTLEYASLAHHLGQSRILSWNIGQLRYRWTSIPRLDTIARRVFGLVGATCQLGTRFVAAALLLVPNQSSAWYALAFFTIAGSSIAWSIRSPQGQDGSDQVFFLLSSSMGLGFAVNSETTWALITMFVVSQLTICYLTAGLTKLFSADWRSGIAMDYVFRTSTYGNEKFYDFILSRPNIKLVVAWSIILFEVMFPLAFFVPQEFGVVLILIPVAFHLATALLMGLNLFFVSFLAAYPFLAVFIMSGERV